jgi:hypothetical protein
LIVSVRLSEFRDPVGDLDKRLTRADVEDNGSAMTSVIISLRDGTKSLLAGGVPDLKLDCLAFDSGRLDFEIDADSRDGLL